MACRLDKLAFAVLPIVATLFSACAAQPVEDSEAPDTTFSTVDEQDEGTSFNGWTQSVSGSVEAGFGLTYFEHTFSRSSGDATRGGGGCLTIWTNNGCSSDANCQAPAQSSYGPSAYGYCYSGRCYSRPGSQADFCSLSPNRGPGVVSKVSFSTYGNAYVVGCMTKTSGPNTACGGTNTGLYMRMMHYLPISIVQP
jgi:hypothetical protein